MTKTVLWMQISLDGYAAGVDGAFDWPIVEDATQQYFIEELAGMGTFAYGRNVYEMMASYWPSIAAGADATPGDQAYSKIWVPMPKVVFSTTLADADWNATVAAGDLADEVAAVRERSHGDIAFFGGPTIANALIERDLIDEYRLFIHPVVLGGGARLFPPRDGRLGVRLEKTIAFGSVLHVHYIHT